MAGRKCLIFRRIYCNSQSLELIKVRLLDCAAHKSANPNEPLSNHFSDIFHVTEVEVKKTIALIDVIWFEKGTNKIVSAFEVEKSNCKVYKIILR